MKESYYKIVMDRMQLSDPRFDRYKDESMILFSDFQSKIEIPSGVALSDEEKKILNGLVRKNLKSNLFSNEEKRVLGRIERLRNFEDAEIDNLNAAIDNCRHKVQAIRYSLSLIESEIKNPILPNYKGLPMNLSETEFINDVIIFELESFLLQVYSSLDVLVHLLKIFYPCLSDNKEHRIGFKGGKSGKAGGKTIEILRDNKGEKEKLLADFFEKEVYLWIQGVYDLRNKIAHRSKIHGLQLFVLDNQRKILHTPRLPDGKDVLVYCNDIHQKLLSMFKNVSHDFLLPHAESLFSI